jgi:hypothetical protein
LAGHLRTWTLFPIGYAVFPLGLAGAGVAVVFMPLQGPEGKSRGLWALLSRLREFVRAGDPWVQIRVLLLLGLGWLLSPLCWWNDLVFNLPLAYGLGWLVKQWRPEWFAGGMVVGYWLSNVAGIVLMQTSALEVFQDPANPSNRSNEMLWGIVTSTLYTVLVSVLVHFGVIHTPIPEASAI